MRELRKLLYRFGIYKTQEGYEPLLVAVELILEAPERLSCLSRRLYPTVAVLCKSNPRTVERNMRYCVARAWEANPDLFSQLAQRPISQAPTTGDFLCMLHNYMDDILFARCQAK